jgi:hypothetical protein
VGGAVPTLLTSTALHGGDLRDAVRRADLMAS